jgi:hypothetical protein
MAIPVAIVLTATGALSANGTANAGDHRRPGRPRASATATARPTATTTASPTTASPTTRPTGAPTAAGNVSYPASDAVIANPERGFMHYADCAGGGLSAQTLSGYRAEGVSQVFCMVYLRSFHTSDIDAATLTRLQRDLSAIRTAGLKTVLRFAYTDSEAGDDAAPAQVLRHIAQLKPYLRDNADVIATVQTGFVGAWGEWYYTRNFGNAGQVSATDQANRRAVVEALLDALPSSRTLQLRTPAIKRGLYGTTAITAAQAFGGSAAARAGQHNDCFLASADDMGTWTNPTAERPYVQAETTYLPMGGETCAPNPPRTDCPTALSELALFHWSYLNADYHPDVLSGWRTGGCMTDIQRRLGYRLTLTDGSFAATASPGGTMQVRLSVRNDGWAAAYNPRPVQLVLLDAAGTTPRRLALTADPRRWLPGTTTVIEQAVTLPADLPPGAYRLALAMPDPAAALAGRPEYAIQTANAGLWDAARGVNDLRHTVTVTG